MQYVFDTMTVQLAGFNENSVSDGTGVRFVIFAQGCGKHCEGCHNEHTWDPEKGSTFKLNDIFDIMAGLDKKIYSGITLSGGEPFDQESSCYYIARAAKSLGLTVWTYTGYLYEDLIKEIQCLEIDHPLLSVTDILVDGPYIERYKNHKCYYYGSSNQRVIDMIKLRNEGKLYLPDGRIILQECE